MKKILALVMLAAMLLSTGCGKKAEQVQQDAAQKVEQAANKADEAKQDAAQKVEQAADAANQARENTEQKVEEIKQEAENQAMEAQQEAAERLHKIAENAEAMREAVSFGGIFPGLTAEQVREIYGEPVQTAGEALTFENGAIVNVDADNLVKSVRLTTDQVTTPEGVSVGMSEYVLNDAYGMADKVRQIADGAEYEYDRGVDKVAKLIFTAKNGLIAEIRSEFNN